MAADKKRIATLVLILLLRPITALAQVSPQQACDAAQETVDRVWRLATQGDLLTPEGWDKMARGAFVSPSSVTG